MLESKRLTLIPLSIEQLEKGLISSKELTSDLNIPIVEQLISGVVTRAVEMKIKKMSAVPRIMHSWFTYWLIIIQNENIGAGMVGFKGAPDENGRVEIGYGIDPVFQGRGYMTEAVRTLTAWAFSHPECLLVTATQVLLENAASQKVLVRNGFVESGADETGISYHLTRSAFLNGFLSPDH